MNWNGVTSVCDKCGIATYADEPGTTHRGDCPTTAPPSALSGVSAEELRGLAAKLCEGASYVHSSWTKEHMARAAAILRALAESMEGGKG